MTIITVTDIGGGEYQWEFAADVSTDFVVDPEYQLFDGADWLSPAVVMSAAGHFAVFLYIGSDALGQPWQLVSEPTHTVPGVGVLTIPQSGTIGG